MNKAELNYRYAVLLGIDMIIRLALLILKATYHADVRDIKSFKKDHKEWQKLQDDFAPEDWVL